MPLSPSVYMMMLMCARARACVYVHLGLQNSFVRNEQFPDEVEKKKKHRKKAVFTLSNQPGAQPTYPCGGICK